MSFKDGQASVEVPGAGPGVLVQLTVRPGGPPVLPEVWPTGDDGGVRIERLPPGRYVLSCTVDGGLRTVAANVPADSVVTLRPVPKPPAEQ